MSGFSSSHPGRADTALMLLRVLVAALLFVHGLARVLNQGVVPFGGFLAGEGLPAGLAIAWFVTGFELVAAPLLAVGIKRLVSPICLVFWFVVGAGRNGMEYSVLLIAVLLAQAWRGWPDFAARRKRGSI